MKRLFAYMLAFAIIVGLVGCGNMTNFSVLPGFYSNSNDYNSFIIYSNNNGEILFQASLEYDGFGGVATVRGDRAEFSISGNALGGTGKTEYVTGWITGDGTSINLHIEDTSLEVNEEYKFTDWYEYQNNDDFMYANAISEYLATVDYINYQFVGTASSGNIMGALELPNDTNWREFSIYKVEQVDAHHYYAITYTDIDKCSVYEISGDGPHGILLEIYSGVDGSNLPDTSHIPKLSSGSKYLDADFAALKIRMGYDLNGPNAGWQGNASNLLYLKNLNTVDCYMNISSDLPELIGADNDGVVFFGVYGTTAYAYVKDFLSDEELMIEPAVYPVDGGKMDAFVWKLENGYFVIIATTINVNWYDRPAFGVAHVRDASYLSFID